MSNLKITNCKNCYRKFGNTRQIIQSPKTGEWVHNNVGYDLKCHYWEEYVATPFEEGE
jgi:hypothetical protein